MQKSIKLGEILELFNGKNDSAGWFLRFFFVFFSTFFFLWGGGGNSFFLQFIVSFVGVRLENMGGREKNTFF